MQTVPFKFKADGRTKPVTQAQAHVLSRAGLGTYETRSMEGKGMEPALTASQRAPDGLGSMTKEQLHALAKERGVQVHHLAGADKVRAALREAV